MTNKGKGTESTKLYSIIKFHFWISRQRTDKMEISSISKIVSLETKADKDSL